MDVASPPQIQEDSELKRKHKHKDKHSHKSKDLSSKKRKHEAADGDRKSKKAKGKPKPDPELPTETRFRSDDSPFNLVTATLYLPLPPISISSNHALSSLLAEHLSPLLLTYYPPLKGVVLAYSNASISSAPPANATSISLTPPSMTLATTADEYGVLYVYLTATFLVFRPQRGHVLEGWINVQSEGFLGAVVLNLFSAGIERKRLPANWKWLPPGELDDASDVPAQLPPTSAKLPDTNAEFDPEKELFKPVALSADEGPLASDFMSADSEAHAVEGSFRSVSGHRVRGTVRFRVVDVDVIPGSERDRAFLSIEGTMLSPEEEARVLQTERSDEISAPGCGQPPPPSVSESGSQPRLPEAEKDSGSSKGKNEKKSKKKRKESKE